MYNPQITANRIKKRAKEQSVSMTQISEICGISKNAIAQSGKSQEGMKAKNLYAIAEVLKCSLDYLFGVTDNPVNSEVTFNVSSNGVVQTHNSSAVVNTTATAQQSADIIGQFLQAFNQLDLDDKIEVIHFALQKAKKGE